MSDPLCGRKLVLLMSYRLCGRKWVQNGRSDPYADGTGKKSTVHKRQNLAVLDRTLLSIKQGPGKPLTGDLIADKSDIATATPLTFKPQLGPTSFQSLMINFDVQTNILLVRVVVIW